MSNERTKPVRGPQAPLPPEEIEQRVTEARKLALKVKPGQLLGDGLISLPDAVVINAATEDRAEAYCRWRIAGYVAGEISSL